MIKKWQHYVKLKHFCNFYVIYYWIYSVTVRSSV